MKKKKHVHRWGLWRECDSDETLFRFCRDKECFCYQEKTLRQLAIILNAHERQKKVKK